MSEEILYNGAISSTRTKYQAKIEMDTKGKIIYVNRFYLKMLGYKHLEELKGKYHSILLDKEYIDSPEYDIFWRDLLKGKIEHGTFKRKNKFGQIVWISATYNILLDSHGMPFKIVKYAEKIPYQKYIINEVYEPMRLANSSLHYQS